MLLSMKEGCQVLFNAHRSYGFSVLQRAQGSRNMAPRSALQTPDRSTFSPCPISYMTRCTPISPTMSRISNKYAHPERLARSPSSLPSLSLPLSKGDFDGARIIGPLAWGLNGLARAQSGRCSKVHGSGYERTRQGLPAQPCFSFESGSALR